MAVAVHSHGTPNAHAELVSKTRLACTLPVPPVDPGERGALTLEQYGSFDSAGDLEVHSQFAISADALLSNVSESVIPAAPRWWRTREPRISLMDEATGGSPIRFEN